MQVYEMTRAHENVTGVSSSDDGQQSELVADRWNTSVAKIWTPPNATFDSPKRKKPDFEWLDGDPALPIFSRRATEAMGELLCRDGELLPVSCAGAEYSVYHTLRVIDAIDWKRAVVERNEHGDVTSFLEYAFDPRKLKGVAVFRLLYTLKSPHARYPKFASAELFVTDAFAVLWRSHKLNNADFDEPS